MFQVKLDDYILYDWRLDDLDHEDMIISNAKISKEANKTGSFIFKIASTHRHFNRIQKLKSIVKVYQRDKLIFRGRVLEDTQGFNKTKNVDCEGELAFLVDSVFRPFNLTGKKVSIRHFMKILIDNHNSQVKDYQKFILGDITVEDPNQNINFSSETALKTWDIISGKIINTYGGYLYITYTSDEMPILNYYQTPPKTSEQNIEYGVNLLDISKLISASNIATACIPYGAVIDETTKERLTIKSVNDGFDYIINEEKAEEFGIIYAKPELVTFDDVTVAATLKSKAEKVLNDSIMLSETIELKAVDLADGKDIYNFCFLDNIKIISLPHGFDNLVYILKKIDLDLFNLAATTITLGETKKTLTDSSLTNYNKADAVIKNVENILSNYTTNEKVTTIVTAEIKNSTVIDEKARIIVLQSLIDYVKTIDFDTYKEENATKLDDLKQQIDDVYSNLQQRFSKLYSFIECDEENQKFIVDSEKEFYHGTEKVATNGNWIDATLTDEFENYEETQNTQYKKVGDVISLNGVVTPTETLIGSSEKVVIFTLPEEYRPATEKTFLCSSDDFLMWSLTIGVNGEVSFSRYGSTEYVDCPNGSWLPFNVTFII